MANKAVGKGFENESFYTNMRFYSFAIENIHVMRSSLQKLIEGIDELICYTILLLFFLPLAFSCFIIKMLYIINVSILFKCVVRSVVSQLSLTD